MTGSKTPDPVAQIKDAKEKGIRFVQLQFTDILGIVKAVTIPIHRMEDSVDHGTWFDGSSIEGFTRIAESDQYLVPDMSTFDELPWQRGSGPRGTARVICDVFTPRGEPFVGDPRQILRRQVARAEKLGYIVNMGPELEFFLFRRDEDGRVAPLPHDLGGYFDYSTDLAVGGRKDMVDALEAFGISVEAGHHEVATGQHEIDFEYADALRTPPTTRSPSSTRSRRSPSSTVSTRPSCPSRSPGSTAPACTPTRACTPWRRRRNAFADPDDELRAVDAGQHVHRRQLAHARGMCAVLAPTGELVQAPGARL